VSPSHGSVVDLEVARELALTAFPEQAGTVVYVDRAPREPGDVPVGADVVHTEHPALVAFRDEMPGANWMHPCTYALIDLEAGDVVASVEADRPPHFGLLPDSWVVAADPEGRADLVPPPTSQRPPRRGE
jgi:hypothetical protein